MNKKALIIKQIAWVSVIPQIIVCILIIKSFRHLSEANYAYDVIFPALILYLSLAFVLRNGIAHAHRKGIKLTRQGNFRKAIQYFEKSYSFFSNHSWIDKWRYLTLFSSSSLSFREMALCNIAYCYLRSGDSPKSKEYYEKAFMEFPESLLAKSSLDMFKAEKI